MGVGKEDGIARGGGTTGIGIDGERKRRKKRRCEVRKCRDSSKFNR